MIEAIAGGLLLKETFTMYQIAGGVVIIVGVYMANAKMKTE